MADDVVRNGGLIADESPAGEALASQMTISDKLKEARGNISKHSQEERLRISEEEKSRRRSEQERDAQAIESEKRNQALEKRAAREESDALAEFKQNRTAEKRAARNKQKAIAEQAMREEEERKAREAQRASEIAELLERERAEAEARRARAKALLERRAQSTAPASEPLAEEAPEAKEPVAAIDNENTVSEEVVTLAEEFAPMAEDDAAVMPIEEAAEIIEVEDNPYNVLPESAADESVAECESAEPEAKEAEKPIARRAPVTDAERREGARARVREFLGYDYTEEEEPSDDGRIFVGEPEPDPFELTVIGPDDLEEDDGIITVSMDDEKEDDGTITVGDEDTEPEGEAAPEQYGQYMQYPTYDPEMLRAYGDAWTDYINKQNEYYAAMNGQLAEPAPAPNAAKPKAKPAAKPKAKPADPSNTPKEEKSAEKDGARVAAAFVPVSIEKSPEPEKTVDIPESESPADDVAEYVAPIDEVAECESTEPAAEECEELYAEAPEAVEEPCTAEEPAPENVEGEPEKEVYPGVTVEETKDERVRGKVRAFEFTGRRAAPESCECEEPEAELPPLNIDDDIVAKILEEGRLTENKKQLKKYISHSDKAAKSFARDIKKRDRLLDKKTDENATPEALVGIIGTYSKILTIRADNLSVAARIKSTKTVNKASSELSEAIEDYNSRVGAYKLLTGESLTRLSSFLPEHLAGGTGRAVIPRLYYRDSYVELPVDESGAPINENDRVATEVINPPSTALEALGGLECNSKSDVSTLVKRGSAADSRLVSVRKKNEKTVERNTVDIERSLESEERIISSRDSAVKALNAKYSEEKRSGKKYKKKLRKIDKKYGKALRAVRKERAALGLESKNARLTAECFAIERERVILNSKLLAEVRAFASDKAKTGVKRELVSSLMSFDKCAKTCSDVFDKPFSAVSVTVADEVADGKLRSFPKIACRKELCEVVGDEIRVVGDRLKARELDVDIKPPKAAETNSFDDEDPLQNGAYVREGLLLKELAIRGETVTDRKGFKKFKKHAKNTVKLLEKTVKQSDKAIFRAHGKNDAEFAIAENIRVRGKLLEARKMILVIAKRVGIKVDKEQDALYTGIEAYNNRVIDYRSVTGQKFRRISAFLPENVMKDGQETDIPEVSYSEHYLEAFAKDSETMKGYTDPYGKSAGFVPVAYPNRRYTENPTVMTTVINPPYSASEKIELDSVDTRGEYRSTRRRDYFILRRLDRAERRLERRKKKNNRRAARFEKKLLRLNTKQDKAVFALESIVPESERETPEYRKRLLAATRKQRRALLKLKYRRSGAALSRIAMQIEAEELVIYRERVAVYAKKLHNVRGYGKPAVISTAKENLLKAIREYNRRAAEFSVTAREPIARISTEIIDSIVREGKVYTFPRLLLCREIIENVAGDRRSIGDKYRYGMPYSVNARGVGVKTGTNFIAMGLGSSLVTVGPDLEPVFGSVSSDFKYIGVPDPKLGREARRAPGDLDKLAREEADKVKEDTVDIEDGVSSYTVAPASFEVGDIEDTVTDALDVKSRSVSTPRELAYLLRKSKKAERALLRIVKREEHKIRALEDKPLDGIKGRLRHAIAHDSAARHYARSHKLAEILPECYGTDGELYALTDALGSALSHHDYSTVNEAVYKLSELLSAPEHRLVDMSMLRYEELVAEFTPLHGEVSELCELYMSKKRPRYSKFEKKLDKKLKKYDRYLSANLTAYALGIWSEQYPELAEQHERSIVHLEALISAVTEALESDKRIVAEETVGEVRRALDESAAHIIECRVDKLSAIGSLVNVRRMNLFAAAKIEIGFGSALRLALGGHGFRPKSRARLRLSEIIGVYNREVGSLDKYLGDEKLSLISPLLPEEVASRSESAAIPELISCEKFTEAFYRNGELLSRLLERSATYRSGADCGFVEGDINRLESRGTQLTLSADARLSSKRDYRRFKKRYLSLRTSYDRQLSALDEAIDAAVDALDRIRDKKIRKTERYNRRVLRTTEKVKRIDKCQRKLSRVLLKYRRQIAKLDKRALAVSILSRIHKGKSVITDELGVARGYEGIIRCGAAERANLERRRLILACHFLRALAERASERHRLAFISDAKGELAFAMAHYNRSVRVTAQELCESGLLEVSGSLVVDVMDTGLLMEDIEASIPEISYLRTLAEYLGEDMRPIRRRV
ncbi:MAG: hypothetical protein IJ488_05345 [Clostridia bacterium]|nr:hypothetical protein [Clostridia bacterium]